MQGALDNATKDPPNLIVSTGQERLSFNIFYAIGLAVSMTHEVFANATMRKTFGLKSFFHHEKTFILGILCLALAYLVKISPFIGRTGHYGSVTEVMFFVICGVILMVAKKVVENAEYLAHHFGEPLGTLILILSASAIELILILTIMLHGPTQEPTLARDTIFAGVILSIDAVLGIALLIGGLKFKEQAFNEKSAYSYVMKLGTMCALGVFIPMVVPTHLMASYKIFVILTFLALYGFFLFFQVGSYSYFFSYATSEDENSESLGSEETRPWPKVVMLVAYLVVIGLLVEFLGIAVDDSISNYGLPNATAALIVALISKTPESLVILRATIKNDMQLVINVALSSALSTMALTIPTVLIVARIIHIDVVIALSSVQAMLLASTIILAFMNMASGKTNAYGGTILLSLFSAYLFTLFF
jgi:Ca2+:H+ antiporter